MSDVEKMTQKSQEAMQAAAQYAEAKQSAAVEPEHLVVSLLEQDGGIVPRVIAKMGQSPRLLIQEFEKVLATKTKVTGANKVMASQNV